MTAEPATKRRSDGATQGVRFKRAYAIAMKRKLWRPTRGIAYVLGRLRCGHVLRDLPAGRWRWANGVAVSNVTRRAMLGRNMVTCHDGRVALRPEQDWTEPQTPGRSWRLGGSRH
jgi:hypothetical protein